MLHAGMIGSGFIGQQHANAYKALDSVHLAAIADVNEVAGRKAAQENGCVYYADVEEMLKREALDFVDVCVPSFLHHSFVSLAARYGKHVLCEKPFALTSEACGHMIDECRAAGVKLMVAQCERWTAPVKAIYELLKRGDIGRIHLAVMTRLAQHPDWTTWHRNPDKSGGGLFDLQVHDIDLLVSMFGEVQSVSAIGWKSDSGCWNHVSAELTFANGAKAVSEGSEEMINGYPFTLGMRITGDNGGAEYRYCGGYNIESSESAETSFVVYHAGRQPEILALNEGGEYAEEISAFARAIELEIPVPIAPEESMYVIRVTEAIKRALETGSHVQLDPR